MVAVFARHIRWAAKRKMPGLVGQLRRISTSNCLPLGPRQAAIVPNRCAPIRGGGQKTVIVVLILQRNNFALDEIIQLGQIIGNFLGEFRTMS
jgi:hypothetical protein